MDLLTANLSKRSFETLLDEFRPSVVGLSVYTESALDAGDLSSMARSRGATVVVGGAHGTFVPEDVLRSGLGDYVVRFEGEATFVELLTHLEYGAPPLDAIRGLAYLDTRGEPVATPPRPRIETLDGLPLPAFDAVPLRSYTCPLVCLTSRGCPGRCLFCLSPPLHGARYRAHSLPRIISELYVLSRRHPGLPVLILDDTFTLDRDRLSAFLRTVSLLLPELIWSCYSRIDALDDEILGEMAGAGCLSIQLGIETGDQEVADSINKRISLGRAEEVVALMEKNGIMPLCSLMIGHHSDTRDTVKRTLEFGRRLAEKYHAIVTFAICSPFPGSPIYERCERLGVTVHATNWNEFVMTDPYISTSHLSRDELRELFFEASAYLVLDADLKKYWQPVLAKRLAGRRGRMVGK